MRLFAVISIHLFAFGLYGQVSEQDSLSLVALYEATDGPNWDDHTNWLQGPVGTWFGISVLEGRVHKVELGNNGLSGVLPGQIGDLSDLRVLNLFGNSLQGEIIPEIGNLRVLEELILSKNDFTGTIPEEITWLDSLRELVLISNYDMTGPIPDLSPLQNLEDLYLDHIQVSGPFPQWILRLKKLRSLALRNTGLTGQIPADLLDSLQTLEAIRFSSNQLSGDISNWLAGPSKFTSIDLYNNLFTGAISEGVLDPEISFLSIGRNLLEGLPDFSSAQEIKSLFSVEENKFGFHELEKVLSVETFFPDRLTIGPQKELLEPDTIIVEPGGQFAIHAGSESDMDSYQWYRNGDLIPGASGRTYEVPDYTDEDAGVYHCIIQHPDFTFDLERSPVTIWTEGTTGTTAVMQPAMNIYPNPVTNMLYLEGKGIRISRIYDESGRLWIETTQTRIPVHHLPGGTYLIKTRADAESVTHLFIKK